MGKIYDERLMAVLECFTRDGKRLYIKEKNEGKFLSALSAFQEILPHKLTSGSQYTRNVPDPATIGIIPGFKDNWGKVHSIRLHGRVLKGGHTSVRSIEIGGEIQLSPSCKWNWDSMDKELDWEGMLQNSNNPIPIPGNQ